MTDDGNINDELLLLKKKSKKKTTGNTIESEDTTKDSMQISPPIVDENLLSDLKEIKKKKNKRRIEAAQSAENEINENKAQEVIGPSYKYEDLLERIYSYLCQENPTLLDTSKKKFSSQPPVLERIGNKKTRFKNFGEICRNMERTTNHVMEYILAELGSTGSIDANDQLTMRGRYDMNQIESILRKYISNKNLTLEEFVQCHTCKSSSTKIYKESRLYFLKCDDCGATCSVATIKSGFQAIIGKRSAMEIK